MPSSERKFFFVHVMKTAGGTLRRHIFENFERSQVYPYGEFDPDLYLANFEIGYLTSLPGDRLEQIRVFTGHFPFVAVELLGLRLTTLTILRDPVERTISYLRANQRLIPQHRGLSLEQIQRAGVGRDYDPRFGRDATWTTAKFIEAIFRTLPPAS